ncbi:MAG TPA: hypothetical protein PK505_04790, partial [Treponemataceae bacterium]|nr:hypothetical protein [Treponemataceae bacterium]
MSSGKKVALSLFISIIAFSAFIFFAYTHFFQAIEVHFYQPMVLDSYEKKLDQLSEAFNRFLELKKRNALAFASETAVRNTASPTQTKTDIDTLENITGSLLTEGSGLLGIRLIGHDGRKIHYSSFSQDLLRKEETRLQYESYIKLDELDYEEIACEKESDFELTFDSERDRFLLSLPFFDTFNIYQGSIVFYYSALSVQQLFISEALISLSETITFSKKGIVLGLAEKGQKEIKDYLESIFAEPYERLYPQFSINEQSFLFLSHETLFNNRKIIFSQLIREDFLVFNNTIKIVLLVCFFISFFLMILFLLNLKSDASLIIRQRIKKFQFALLNEYLETKEKINWNDVIASIESRKVEVALSLTKSLGRKAKKHQDLLDALLEKSWDEIMASLTRSKNEFVQNVHIDTDEIRAMLEEILLSTRQGGEKLTRLP